MSIFNPRQALATFRKDSTGSVAVETALIFPTLLFALFVMMNIFDAYRAKSTTEKAAFAVSDMLSRETMAVDANYIDGAHAVLEQMSTVRSGHDLTVSHVYWSEQSNGSGELVLAWSHSNDGGSGITASEFEAMKDKLPVLVHGESLIVVETSAQYSPPILAGWSGTHVDAPVLDGNGDPVLDQNGDAMTERVLSPDANPLNMEISTFVFTRPRFAPQLAWSNS